MPFNLFDWKSTSSTFVVIVYLSILLNIESWPFSDFRVYQSQFHPERVGSYRLSIEENGVERWLFTDAQAYKNNQINHVFIMNKSQIKYEDFKSLSEYFWGQKCSSNKTHTIRLKKLKIKCKDLYCNDILPLHEVVHQLDIPLCSNP